MLRTFQDDEAGYGDWVRDNPLGFVLNLAPSPGAESKLLHLVECKHLGPGAGDYRQTSVPKTCGDDIRELRRHADSAVGRGQWRWCRSCMSDVPAETIELAGRRLLQAARILTDEPEYQKVTTAKDPVLSEFGPPFSVRGLESLDRETVSRFLNFSVNRHWSGIHRKKNALAAAHDKLKGALRSVLAGGDTLGTRVQAALRIDQLGKSTLTPMLLVGAPHRFGVWNEPSEAALRALGVWPRFGHVSNEGPRYAMVNPVLLRLSAETGLDLWDLDAVLGFYERVRSTVENDMPNSGGGTRAQTGKEPLNRILYGPPGTGKTYRARRLAVSLCGSPGLDGEALLERYRELSRDGRIEFVTFHQSFSYEDFVEGIRPEPDEDGQIRYEPRDGVFKSICSRAQRARARGAGRETPDLSAVRFWKVSLGRAKRENDAEIYEDCIRNGRIRVGYGWDVDYSGMDDHDAIRAHVTKLHGEGHDFAIRVVNDLKNRMSEGDIVLVSHALEGIRAIGVVAGDYERLTGLARSVQSRPVTWLRVFDEPLPAADLLKKQLSQMTVYELKRRVLDVTALEQLLAEGDAPPVAPETCVLIIDEINRANVSKVLGELITLLEPDKRLGGAEEVRVRLPYSPDSFGVPPNLYVIGTMNTADRSLAALDVALRRRFEFVPCLPDPSVVTSRPGGIDVAALMSLLNRRIALLLDRDHSLGHAYFMAIESLDDLKHAFLARVIPLLEEYFHGDWTKVALVLQSSRPGDGDDAAGSCILSSETVSAGALFGTPDGDFEDATEVHVNPAFVDATGEQLREFFLALTAGDGA